MVSVQSNVRVENDPRWNQSNFLPSEMSRLQSQNTLPNFKHNTLVAEVRSEPGVPESMPSVCCTHIDSFLMEQKSASAWNIRKDAYFILIGITPKYICTSSRTQTPHWVQFSFVLRGKLTFYETQLLEGTLRSLTICNSHVFLGSRLWYISKINLTHLCSAGVGL